MPYYKVVEESGTKELKDYAHPPKSKESSANNVSYDSSGSPLSAVDVQGAIDELAIGNLIKNITYPVGTIIESTTCDTMAKVITTYGGTTWIQHSGYVLRGATSGVVANSATKTGGSDNAVIVKHNHGGATGSMNRNNPHSHGINQPTQNGDAMGVYGGGGYGGWGLAVAGTNNNFGRLSNQSTDINHEHSIQEQGEDGTNKNIPNYKSVYIWERTA